MEKIVMVEHIEVMQKQSNQCSIEACKRKANGKYCREHGVNCVWCNTEVMLQPFPFACSNCGTMLGETLKDPWEKWSELAKRKGRTVPEGIDPNAYANTHISAVLHRKWTRIGSLGKLVHSRAEAMLQAENADFIETNHAASKPIVSFRAAEILDLLDVVPRAVSERNTWFNLAKRMLSKIYALQEENNRLRAELDDASARLCESEEARE